jgi:hypothetical protein
MAMRPGRYLRQMMQPDPPGAEAERIRQRAAAKQAIAEREARWPLLTAENAQEAIGWQDARVAELMARGAP